MLARMISSVKNYLNCQAYASCGKGLKQPLILEVVGLDLGDSVPLPFMQHVEFMIIINLLSSCMHTPVFVKHSMVMYGVLEHHTVHVTI